MCGGYWQCFQYLSNSLTVIWVNYHSIQKSRSKMTPGHSGRFDHLNYSDREWRMLFVFSSPSQLLGGSGFRRPRSRKPLYAVYIFANKFPILLAWSFRLSEAYAVYMYSHSSLRRQFQKWIGQETSWMLQMGFKCCLQNTHTNHKLYTSHYLMCSNYDKFNVCYRIRPSGLV
jgi:hypothetical protein